ncbi:MAG TPA: hypothetical protein PKK06_00995 [Phycisphaerae bacterium]|nr:hypothetical protein [Phycisphaerae bacterium]HNU43816.1 hypothetical protein [Phycisphaerae bacterium]
MCNLLQVDKCHAVLEAQLERLAARHPGGAAVAYLEGGSVRVEAFRSYSQAEEFYSSSLSAEQQEGAVVLQLPDKHHVLML